MKNLNVNQMAELNGGQDIQLGLGCINPAGHFFIIPLNSGTVNADAHNPLECFVTFQGPGR